MARTALTLPRVILLAALALAVGAMVRWTACAARPAAPAGMPPASSVGLPGVAPPGAGADPGAAPERLRTQSVVVYYPAREADGLIGETREIFLTASPGDRAKQILSELIAGPQSERTLPAIPPGTRLRQVFVLEDGVAWVDFSGDFESGMGGGSTVELLTVYAVVDSLALNVAEIRRVGILIDGRPAETLNGHLDLSRPLPPELSLIQSTGEGTIVRGQAGRSAVG